jgi:hypothetical protein
MMDAVGDPDCCDQAFAQPSIHRGIVAPLWLLDSWMMAGLENESEQAVLADGAQIYRAAPDGQRRVHAQRRTLRDDLNDWLEEYGKKPGRGSDSKKGHHVLASMIRAIADELQHECLRVRIRNIQHRLRISRASFLIPIASGICLASTRNGRADVEEFV